MIKAGLIGKGINYSYSKIIHEAITDCSYDIINCDDLKDFFKNDFNYDFINVTIPYKKEIIKYLDYLDPISKEIGACNLVIKKNNRLYGYNTDYYGFIKFIDDNNIIFENKRVCILGTGGASQMIQKVAIDRNVKSLIIVSREEYKYYDNYITYDKLGNYGFDIIINATPVGTSPDFNNSLIDFDKINVHKDLIVIDLIYNPNMTKLCIDSKLRGLKSYNGKELLVNQAIYSYYFLSDDYKDFINNKDLFKSCFNIIDFNNIVLIGMPYSGKSTLGKKIAKEKNKELIDIDEMIEEKYGRISDIFKNFGEKYFRTIEKEIIKELSLKKNCVIVPGGGAILDYENYIYLKANGTIYFLDTDIDTLIERSKLDNNRPLVQSEDDLIKLYENRYNIYLKYCDKVISG